MIDYHPRHPGLFLATGGSGHGFKFLPVIGDKIVDAIEGLLHPELQEMWSWRKEAVKNFLGTEDGSRRGKKGMLLDQEMNRGGIL